MSFQTIFISVVFLFFSINSHALSRLPSPAVHVDIVSDSGRVFPMYKLDTTQSRSNYRAWLEAEEGANYAIRVYNNSKRRIGLVIAVDGRNIISGQKSDLKSNERMYILNPWETASYDGWRTSAQRINQFFFTDVEQSYAEVWGDRSAMGVIAVAVFPEKKTYRKRHKHAERYDADVAESQAGRSAPAESDMMEKKSKQAGTGFGSSQYSYAKRINFSPMPTVAETHFFKYEWRESLCDKGVISCRDLEPNRFWPEDRGAYGYAPFPPR